MYSYPKEDLKQMVTDEKFLKTIDDYQLAHYFGPEKKLDDKIIIEDDDEDEEKADKEDLNEIARKQSEYLPSSTEYL